MRFSALLLAILLSGCSLIGAGMVGNDARGLELKRRGATVVLALEAYRRDTGKLPVHLFDLLPKYLPQIPDGLATDYRPQDNTFGFSYQRRLGGLTTTCTIEIGRRVWDCRDSL
ncbi:MAG: hypothetical protein JSR60_06430 [Proteobacteria bacterium]|nr:hypothetical protein [Pseudomonadota bacterium]